MREIFQQNSGGGRCPGEKGCQRFQDSAGDSDDEKADNACTTCEFLDTKPKASGGDADALSFVCQGIERIRAEQRAGFKVELTNISGLEFESLLVWHDLESQYERIKQAETNDLLKAFLGGKS